ncbi:beta-caryophyllene synthase, partial [Tanacetum coccineum]
YGFSWGLVSLGDTFIDIRGRKNNHRKKTDTTTGTSTGSVTKSDGTLNNATLIIDSIEKEETPSAGNAPGKSSYANVTGKPIGKKLNFRTLYTPRRVTYPVVANYVRNTWSKYELVRSMFSSSTGLFSFQFSFMVGLNAMLENGLWFIRDNPLIVKKWHPDVNILKEDVGTIPVWVKLHRGF